MGKRLHLIGKENIEKGKEYNINTTIVQSQYHRHAIELTQQLVKQDFNYIIAVGGDGTMNEIGSVLVEYPGIKTGLIPSGTGNDFNQILGFPNRFEEEH